jgi:hypothetical protein
LKLWQKHPMLVSEAQLVSSFQKKDVKCEGRLSVNLDLLFLRTCISHKRYILPAKQCLLHCGPWQFYKHSFTDAFSFLTSNDSHYNYTYNLSFQKFWLVTGKSGMKISNLYSLLWQLQMIRKIMKRQENCILLALLCCKTS